MAAGNFPHNPVASLLHDAAEAYIADIAKPIKQYIKGYKCMEEGILVAIGLKYDLEPFFWRQTKEADLIMLATEARDLMEGNQEDWQPLPEPLPEKIIPWSWDLAEREFLRLAQQYKLED